MTGEDEDRASAPLANVRACPICGKPQDPEYRPFCSKRCADVDLGRWLSGSYAIPVTEEEDEDGDTPGAGAAEGKPVRAEDAD